jgi:hypothetical protein
MDLVRAILLTIEASEQSSFHLDKDANPYKRFSGEYTRGQIYYHLGLLRDAGLTRYSKTGYTYEVEVENTGLVQEVEEEAISRLTWEGHDFLDAAKNETIWQKAKTLVQEKGGALTFDVAKAVLAQVALKQVGL